jgi:Predicted periplasmic lipoprotein (DUF2279)
LQTSRIFLLIIVAISYSMPGVSQLTVNASLNESQTYDTLTVGLTNPEKRSDSNFQIKKRLWTVAGGHTALYAGSFLVLNEAWYKGYPKQGLASFDDSKEWLQVDKFGHAWSAYGLSRVSAQTWGWTGMDRKKADILGAASGFGFLTVIEILDARSAKWGFSWTDIAANTFGTGLYLSQQLAWQEQRIALKYSFHRKSHADTVLKARANDLFGSTWYEGMLKDYNSQTYWLSANLKSFFKESNLPPWLNIAFGYGAEGLYGGFENLARNNSGNLIFDRRDIQRVRQFYLAPDIDFTKIKTNKKWLKRLFFVLQGFKFPAPTLMVNSKGKWRGYWGYF